MQKIIKIITCYVSFLLFLGSCEENKRYEISEGDGTPPAVPAFRYSTPLPGGARVHFTRPSDEDLLYVEVSYMNTINEKICFTASYFTDSLDVVGFRDEGEQMIELCAVDRAGNRSQSVPAKVNTLKSPVVIVAESVKLLPSFAAMIVKWENDLKNHIYVDVNYGFSMSGVRHNYTRVFSSVQTESRSIDSLKLFNGEPVTVSVNVRDKHGNTVPAGETTIVLPVDAPIAKENWTAPAAGTEMGGVVQPKGVFTNSDMNVVFDGIFEIDVMGNYFQSMAANPWNIIIDLGQKYELSRLVTFQRYSGGPLYSVQNNFYRGDNVMAYNMYIWDDAINEWKLTSRHTIISPLVRQDQEYVDLGRKGEEAFLYPEEPRFSIPTRYFRFEAINGQYISEVTLYGRKVN